MWFFIILFLSFTIHGFDAQLKGFVAECVDMQIKNKKFSVILEAYLKMPMSVAPVLDDEDMSFLRNFLPLFLPADLFIKGASISSHKDLFLKVKGRCEQDGFDATKSERVREYVAKTFSEGHNLPLFEATTCEVSVALEAIKKCLNTVLKKQRKIVAGIFLKA